VRFVSKIEIVTTSLSRATLTVVVLTAVLLMVPLVAMQFTSEVTWGAGDFVVAGILIFGAAMSYWLGARRSRSARHRLALAVLILIALGVVWAELAVGLFS